MDTNKAPRQDLEGIAIRAALLGGGAGASLVWASISTFPQMGVFLSCLCLFHILEFWVTARYNSTRAGVDAFILSNGKEYQIAHISAVVEGLVEAYMWPTMKQSWLISSVGMGLIMLGQIVRTMAMATAAQNFSHQVVTRRGDSHELVTHGVYAFVRHPSYFGFFCWGLGTQILLLNPICTIGYATALWRFFHDRVVKEEKLLVSFFGQDYVRYQRRSYSGIPFVK